MRGGAEVGKIYSCDGLFLGCLVGMRRCLSVDFVLGVLVDSGECVCDMFEFLSKMFFVADLMSTSDESVRY